MLDKATPPAPQLQRRIRDVRLDVFRGLGMFIIFIAHVPDNPWSRFIPARFGFSDATEIFVFCSGMASALAFGRIFDSHGFAIGTARILYRCWQVYWSHIGLFLVVCASMLAVDRLAGTGDAYIRGIGLDGFIGPDTGPELLGLMTLTYVPHYFDILPMYLVILALLPIMAALSRFGLWPVLAASVALWLAASFGHLELPAEQAKSTSWFFNPFCWQLIFFTGFAFMRGLIPAPPVSRTLIGAAVAVLVIALPFSWQPALDASPTLASAHGALLPFIDKSHLGVLRIVHFLALAYLAVIAAGEHGRRLRGRAAEVCRLVGQQALATFMTGLTLSFLAGAALNFTGRGMIAVAAVNVACMTVMVLAAWLVAWFKSVPWARVHQVAGRPPHP